jgi:hypothetical protein
MALRYETFGNNPVLQPFFPRICLLSKGNFFSFVLAFNSERISMGRVLKWVGVVLVVVFLGIQFVRPDRTNPQEDESLFYANHVTVPPEIARILERSCFDCHSQKTVWPWYSQIAPISWLLVKDVADGRKHLNFSRWGAYAKVRQMTALNDIVDEVSSNGMPLPNYLTLHSEARLDSTDRAKIIAWAESEKENIVP